MEIRNASGEVLSSPDMTKGIVEERSETIHHEAVEGVKEQGHWNTIAEYPNGGKDVEWVVDVAGVEAVDAYDEEVRYLLYIPYTEEELAKLETAKTVSSQAKNVALELAEKLATATTLSQVRSFSKQVAEEYADKTITSGAEQDWTLNLTT